MAVIAREWTLWVCPGCGAHDTERFACCSEPGNVYARQRAKEIEVVPAEQLRGAVEAIRTLREYIGNPEGDGPIRYTEALALCDSILHPHGGQSA